jgi:lipoate-protein ligase A
MVLIFQIILGIGIAGFLFVAFRKIPVLLNYPRKPYEETSLRQKIKQRVATLKDKTNKSDFLHESIIPGLEKFLRKFNVFILKLHNLSAKIVSRLKRKKQEKIENEQKDNNDLNLPS